MNKKELENKLLGIIPYNGKADIGANALEESTIITVRDRETVYGDKKDFKPETVMNVFGNIFVFGYFEDETTLRVINTYDLDETALEEIARSAEAAARQGQELYTITETVKDYKGACTNVYGISADRNKAKEIMQKAIHDRFEHRFEESENPKSAFEIFYLGYVNKEENQWRYFDGDTDYTFEIHKTKQS